MRALVLPLFLVLSSCGGFLGRAGRAYDGGRYFEALEMLSAREADLHELGPGERARYGATRGRAHVRLGDYVEGRRWLRFASEVGRSHPNELSELEHVAIRQGYSELSAAVGVQIGPDSAAIELPTGEAGPGAAAFQGAGSGALAEPARP